MNRFVEAKLINFNTIRVLIYNPNKDLKYIFTLVVEDEYRFKLNGRIIDKKENSSLYEFKLKDELKLGFDYRIGITNLGVYPLNVSSLVETPQFDEKFYYDGNDLGVTYNKSESKFAIWAPLASSVLLLIDNKDIYVLKRHEKGVYRVNVKGDLENRFYNYIVTNSGISISVLDPYGKASTVNSKHSVILNFSKFIIPMNDNKLPKMKSYLDAIIYEGNVRDLTIDPNTNIKNKGKFLGLIEENRKTINGDSCGFDYIKSLGITHLQLLPVNDFLTTDETNPSETYNWGYDPVQYFTLEGSYASKINDPSSRIRDFLELVSKYHAAKIRIVLDVVFNHIYEHQYSSLEAVVPNYYFRRQKDNSYFNASGCGNDFASERKMARKFILDVCTWWVTFYHIDGFRFDLMGLIDVETINLIKEKVKKIKPDFMIYGEGWNMNSGHNLTLANMNNHKLMDDVSFFNDNFRDVIIGNLYNKDPGYGLDNIVYRNRFKEVFCGSSFNIYVNSRFDHITRTINFVECHDNNTLYDKIKMVRNKDNELQILKRVNFVNDLVVFSMGVPFFHAGQEIGLSKKGHDNTYNEGDAYNMFDYSLLKERKWMVEHFKAIIKARKLINVLHETDMYIVDQDVDFFDISNGGLFVIYKSELSSLKDKHTIKLIINPSLLPLYYNIDKGEDDSVLVDPISTKIIME